VNDYRENDPWWRSFLRLDDCPGSDGPVWVEPEPEFVPKPCGRRLTDEEWVARENAANEAIDRRRG
jgi:hypothetical protein